MAGVVELENVPLWNQLDDPRTADHKPPTDPDNDCGEECCCIGLKHITDVELPADLVHDDILGDGVKGRYTYGSQLAAWLGWRAGILCYVHAGLDVGGVRSMVQGALDDGRLCIVLVRFSASDPDSGHWIVGYGYGDEGGDNLIAVDPWGGWRRVIPWAESYWFKGDVVEFKRRRCIDVAA